MITHTIINCFGVLTLVLLTALISRRAKSETDAKQLVFSKIQKALGLFLFVALSQCFEAVKQAYEIPALLENLWLIADIVCVSVGVVLMLQGVTLSERLRMRAQKRVDTLASKTHNVRRDRTLVTNDQSIESTHKALSLELARIRLSGRLQSLASSSDSVEKLESLFTALEFELSRVIDFEVIILERLAGAKSHGAHTLKRRKRGGSLVRAFYPRSKALSLDHRFRNSRGIVRSLPVVDTRSTSSQISGEAFKSLMYCSLAGEGETTLLLALGRRANAHFSANDLRVITTLLRGFNSSLVERALAVSSKTELTNENARTSLHTSASARKAFIAATTANTENAV